MGLNNRRLFNQYGQWNADNRLLNAEDVKPDVINGATGKSTPGSGVPWVDAPATGVPWVDAPATGSPWADGSYNLGGEKKENPASAYAQSFKPAPTTPTAGTTTGTDTGGTATGTDTGGTATVDTATGTDTGGTDTGGTESDPVRDYYGNYLDEQEILIHDFYAGEVADINRREQEAQNYYQQAMVLAMTDMEKARQTYGAKAEELAQAGLSNSGLSDYAARQMYAAYVNEKQNIRREEKAAMDALAAERAEYEAGKQATDATEQAGVAAYNALSLLMSPTDADGNEKTALSYQQAVQELRNQGVSEDTIKEATGKYAASLKTTIEETISKGNVATLATISEETFANYVEDELITADEAADYINRARKKRFGELEKYINNGDIDALREFFAEYTGNKAWLDASATSDDAVGAAAHDLLSAEGFGSEKDVKEYKEETVREEVAAESGSLAGTLDIGAKIIAGGDEAEINAYFENVVLAAVDGYHENDDCIELTVNGKKYLLDAGYQYPQKPLPINTYPVGSIMREGEQYYILTERDGVRKWRSIADKGVEGETITQEQKQVLYALLDKKGVVEEDTSAIKIYTPPTHYQHGAGTFSFEVDGKNYVLTTEFVAQNEIKASANQAVGAMHKQGEKYYVLSYSNGEKLWKEITFDNESQKKKITAAFESYLKQKNSRRA